MRFAYDFTSLSVLLLSFACLAGVIGFAVILILQSFARTRAKRQFGDPDSREQPRLVGLGP